MRDYLPRLDPQARRKNSKMQTPFGEKMDLIHVVSLPSPSFPSPNILEFKSKKNVSGGVELKKRKKKKIFRLKKTKPQGELEAPW